MRVPEPAVSSPHAPLRKRSITLPAAGAIALMAGSLVAAQAWQWPGPAKSPEVASAGMPTVNPGNVPGERKQASAAETQPARDEPVGAPLVPQTTALSGFPLVDGTSCTLYFPPADEKQAAQPEPAAEQPKFEVKRRRNLSEDDLRDQLAKVPEIGLTMNNITALGAGYQREFQFGMDRKYEPTTLLRVRPDLADLPVRHGSTCRLESGPAATLQALSRKLRVYVEQATPRDAEGNRPDPAKLRELLREETRKGRPEWLRAEAIPVLQQMLMHEDTPLRQMLVELLAGIGGKLANVALAWRAVFDPSPEVRAQAVEALRARPKGDVRSVFLSALRYPLAPFADHAAEALAALKDEEAVPALVSMLRLPDPGAPAVVSGGRMAQREVVRANHTANCLMCHAPANSTKDPVVGLVPGVTLMTGGGRSGGGGGRYTGGSGGRTTNSPGVAPLWVRADITFLRQDFSILLRLPADEKVPLRFDYLVRTRFLTPTEVLKLNAKPRDKTTYEQREAVQFALRELTGKDPGNTTEAWVELFPRAELEMQAARLGEALIKAPVLQKDVLLLRYKDAKEAVYTHALAYAIPALRGTVQDKAREALVERLTRLNTDELRQLAEEDDSEIRQAAKVASERRGG